MTDKQSNAFGSTFAFSQLHKAKQKMQKSYQANAPTIQQRLKMHYLQQAV